MIQIIKPPYYIEFLTRDKQLKSRHRFEQLPITIGRAFDNDLVVDDPYVSHHHAIIESAESGHVYIRDLDSENGLIANGQQQSNYLIQDDSIRLGHSNIRFKHAESKVAETLSDTTSHQWEGWLPGMVGLILLLCTTITSSWLGTTEKFSILTVLSDISSVLLVVFLWVGAWGLITRLVTGGSARFGRHTFVLACAILLASVWDVVSIIIAYSLSLEFLIRYGSHFYVAIFTGMIFFHLKTINEQRQKRFAIIAVLLACIGSGIVLTSNYNETGKLADKLYMPYILPPEFRLSPDYPVEHFIEDVKTLKPELDKTREVQDN